MFTFWMLFLALLAGLAVGRAMRGAAAGGAFADMTLGVVGALAAYLCMRAFGLAERAPATTLAVGVLAALVVTWAVRGLQGRSGRAGGIAP